MKKLFFFLLVALLGSQDLLGQNQEVVYGTVRSDGFQKITKGAFWSKRPEAKEVYEGSYPSGVEIILLSSDYFVRFVDGEHNSKDLNYIVFPKGEKIYKVLSSGKYYAAICGNEIEFFQPVEKTRVVYKDSILWSGKKVYKVDTIHRKTYVYDTVVHETYVDNTTTNNRDYYWYGNGSSYYFAGNYSWPVYSSFPVVYCSWYNFYEVHPNYCENHYRQESYHHRERDSWGERYTPPVNPGGGRYTPPGNDEGGGRYTPPANENTRGQATRYTPPENGGGKKSTLANTNSRGVNSSDDYRRVAMNTASSVVARSDRPQTQRSYSQPQQQNRQFASPQTQRTSVQHDYRQSNSQTRQYSQPTQQRGNNYGGNTRSYVPTRSNNSVPMRQSVSGGAVRSSGGSRR